MERECRQVVENIRFTKEEALILKGAEIILRKALDYIKDYQCDEDLNEALKNSYDALRKSNPRTNVNITLDPCGGKDFNVEITLNNDYGLHIL